MSNVLDGTGRHASWTNRSPGDNTGGDEPPGGDRMEARVNAIEKSLPDIRERLVRVETKLDHTATKTDLADLSIALHKSMNEQTWKFIAAATSMSALFAAIAFGLARLLK